MREEYTVEAFSPTLNQSLREFNLEMNNPALQDQRLAQKFADSFATRLNKNGHMGATDWVGRTQWQRGGIETLNGYIG